MGEERYGVQRVPKEGEGCVQDCLGEADGGDGGGPEGERGYFGTDGEAYCPDGDLVEYGPAGVSMDSWTAVVMGCRSPEEDADQNHPYRRAIIHNAHDTHELRHVSTTLTRIGSQLTSSIKVSANMPITSRGRRPTTSISPNAERLLASMTQYSATDALKNSLMPMSERKYVM